MTEETSESDWLEYFSGGVPTGEFFRMTLNDLSRTINREAEGIDRTNELCLIGLVSYFEAFCKDHFSSLINIEPTLLAVLRDNGQDTSIDSAMLLEFGDEWRIRLGFIVSEKYDFGSAQKINSLYNSLLKITPFSKSEAKFYAGILRDRNLLVHHGGVCTHSYTKQAAQAEKISYQPYFDSLLVKAEYLDERITFIEEVAKKILKASHEALSKVIGESNSILSEERGKALSCLMWWGDENEI